MQWLFTGMTDEDFQRSRRTVERGEPSSMIKDVDTVEHLREQRRLRTGTFPHTISNARIKHVVKYQSCMVSKLLIIWKQAV